MMHKRRRWGITRKTVEQIAEDIIQHDVWVLCNGYLFDHAGQTYALLNDSTSEDSIQEYAIVLVEGSKGGSYWGRQVESLTTSWLRRDPFTDVLATADEVAAEIRKATEFREWMKDVQFAAEEGPQHTDCPLCA